MDSIRILHLEDDFRDRELVQFALRAGGIKYETRYAISREEFLREISEHVFDLVIADYRLPAFDGAEALKIIRERFEDLPFILLSGTLGEERAVEILRRGATDFVLKENMRRLVPSIQRAVQELRALKDRREAEIALKESEERFRIIAEQTGQLMYDYNFQTSVLLWAGAIEPLTGFTPEEYQSVGYEEWAEFIHPDDRAEVQAGITSELKSRSHYRKEYRYRRKDGSYIHVEDRGSLLYNDDKIAVRLLGTMSDITLSKAAKVALQKSELQYRTVVECMNEGLLQVDNDDRIIFANESFRRLVGYSEESITGKIGYELLLFKEDWEDLKEKNRTRTEGRGDRYHMRMRTKAGETIWMEISAAPVYDAAGRVTGSIGIHTDITDRLKAEEQLRKLSRAVAQSPASIIITDINGCIEYVNQRFTDNTGYTAEEVLGVNPRILKGDHTTQEEYRRLWETILAGGEWRGEFHTRKKSGEMFWESASISPITDASGRITHFVAVKEDITERKRFEEELINAKLRAEQSDRLKDAFIANISHEIRTPLNVIIGYIRLIAADYAHLIKPEERYFFESTDRAGQRLMRTVEHILNISRLQTQSFTIKKQELIVRERVDNLVKDFLPVTSRKNLTLTCECSVPDAVIFADAEYFDQIIMNLLDNALKFTEQGGASVRIDAVDDRVVIVIADTGIGISAEYLPELFKVFSQEGTGYTRKYEGLGLGLALVHRYVEMNEGTIDVESVKGRGTTFTLRFPILRLGGPPAARPAAPSQPTAVKPHGEKRATLLLVEDDEQNQQLVRVLFSSEFDLRMVPDAIGAIRCLRDETIDLILMDLSLAGDTDGIELTKQIRLDPEFRDIPIIALTAHAFPKDRQNCLDAGCNDYVPKPFQRAHLRELIHSYIRKS